MLRGVRPDVDLRVLEAVKRWRFDPPRLNEPTPITNETVLPAGTAVSTIITVTVPLESNF
jgi:hypothetical protein